MAILGYIYGLYNQRRRHSALGWKSPVALESQAIKLIGILHDVCNLRIRPG